MMSSKKVIIIGAGAAGIAAATRLYENGITDVLVLEAENRIGGRVYTLDVEGDGGFIEIGAQWVHGEQMNVVYELASPRNLLTISGAAFENLLFVQSSAQIVSSKISAKMLELFDTVVDDIDVDVHEYETSGEYFIEKIQKLLQEKNIEINETLKEQFIEWFHQLINLLDASDSWFDSAASTLTEYWECAGNELISWKEHGYRSIFSILMEKSEALSNGNFSKQNIINNSEVIQITPYENGARIKCDDDTEYFADHVIVTLSLGVLKEKFDILFPCDVITDKKRQAIKNLQIGTVDKLYLRFPYKWWPEKIDGISLLWSEEHRLKYDKKGLKWLTDIFSFSVVDNNPLMLCGWIVGSSARTMESIDETLVKSQLTQLLRDFLGHVYKIPEPNWFFRSTWQSNNHFRGSYSFRTPSCDKLKISATDLATPYVNKDDIPTILFAGEATHEHFYSTVHGAIETGWREADRILSLTPKSSTK